MSLALQPIPRRIVLGGLLTLGTITGGACACHAQTARGPMGCYVPPAEAPRYFSATRETQFFERGDEAIEPRSGNPQLDRALAQALATIAQTFAVLPGFAYYHEDGSSNAFATPAVKLQRTDGTVLFGLKLLTELMARPEHVDASIVSVCAHEFGHIASFKTGLIRKLAPDPSFTFRSEQFADFMSGYFAGTRKLLTPDYPAVIFATTQRDAGDTTRGTHGTFEERGAAVVEGFKSAYERRANLNDGMDQGSKFAMSRG